VERAPRAVTKNREMEGKERERKRRTRFADLAFVFRREEEIVQNSFEKVNNVASQATAELGMPCTSSQSSSFPFTRETTSLITRSSSFVSLFPRCMARRRNRRRLDSIPQAPSDGSRMAGYLPTTRRFRFASSPRDARDGHGQAREGV